MFLEGTAQEKAANEITQCGDNRQRVNAIFLQAIADGQGLLAVTTGKGGRQLEKGLLASTSHQKIEILTGDLAALSKVEHYFP